MTTCPFCAEEVKDGAVGCAHCGHRLDEVHRRSMTKAWIICAVLLAACIAAGVTMYKANQDARKQPDRMACQLERQTGGPTPDC